MTGSVAGESRNTQPTDEPNTSTGKSSAGEKTAEQPQDAGSVSSSPKEDTGFLPPLETLTLKASDPPVSPQPASSPESSPAQSPARKFSRCASSLPAVVAAKRTPDEGAGSLARYGRAQSVLTLCSGGSSSKPSAQHPRINVEDGATAAAGRGVLDDSSFHGYYGARSELDSGTASLRRRPRHHHHHHHHHEGRAYGTLERATSYGSLTTPRPHHHFRSANSTRPRPAPPCTTTHLDYGRPTYNTTTTTAGCCGNRTVRGGGTPRRNNPHPVGLHFQSPYNRDGKTFEVWSPDESSITNHLPQMCKHIDQTNFTCGKTQLYPSRGLPLDLPVPLPSSSFSSSSSATGSSHGASSVYHSSYRSPQGRRDHDLTLPTTRFGSSHNRAAAIGVVPNAMSPHCAERRVRLHVPRGQKLESLV